VWAYTLDKVLHIHRNMIREEDGCLQNVPVSGVAVFGLERLLADKELVKHNAHTPDVHLLIMRLPC
jgi:hypothetical protein